LTTGAHNYTISRMPYVLIMLNVLLATGGQLLFKRSADFINSNPDLKFPFYYLTNPWFYTAVLLFVISTFVWTQALTRVPISIAYPMASLAYILTVVGAYYIFQEKITIIGMVGILLIISGVTLTAVAASK